MVNELVNDLLLDMRSHNSRLERSRGDFFKEQRIQFREAPRFRLWYLQEHQNQRDKAHASVYPPDFATPVTLVLVEHVWYDDTHDLCHHQQPCPICGTSRLTVEKI